MLIVVLAGWVKLTADERAELRALADSPDVPAAMATRARIVLWWDEGRRKKDIAEAAGVSRPTVNLWLSRYAALRVAGLLDRSRAAPREQVPPRIRARVLALTRTSPPPETGLARWTSRQLAAYIARTEGVSVSHHWIAALWRTNRIRPHRPGAVEANGDFRAAREIADIVGLYLDPPGGAVVLSLDDSVGTQDLDPALPLLSIEVAATGEHDRDRVRHDMAARPATGDVVNGCRPSRDDADFLAFLEKAIKRRRGRQIHVVLDKLPGHTTPEVLAWLDRNPRVRFHVTPVSSSWVDQIETWFGTVTHQSIRRGTFPATQALISRIRDHIAGRGDDPTPFVWTAAGGKSLATVRIVRSGVNNLVGGGCE